MTKHMEMQSCRTLFYNNLFEQSCANSPATSLQCGVESVQCGVWSVEGVWSAKFGVGSVECVKCRMWRVQCGRVSFEWKRSTLCVPVLCGRLPFEWRRFTLCVPVQCGKLPFEWRRFALLNVPVRVTRREKVPFESGRFPLRGVRRGNLPFESRRFTMRPGVQVYVRKIVVCSADYAFACVACSAESCVWEEKIYTYMSL